MEGRGGGEHTAGVADPLEQRVREHCRRHDLLPAGEPVLALVSGGADSTCLAGMLDAVHDGPLVVLTFDHGLRPEAPAEAAAAAGRARARGHRARIEALGLAPGAGLQARARDARLAVARRVAAEEGCAAIATGHTASDQAETVLFRMARGSGRTGALGMAPRNGDLVRPLLSVTRSETAAWCAERGLAVVDDPSNRDPAYARTRVRDALVPALAAVHPGAERHVAGLADALRDEDEVLERVVGEAWERCARSGGLSVEALCRESPVMRRLLVRRLLVRAGLPGDAVARASVERALDAARRGARADLPGGGVAVERRALVAFGEPRPAPAAAALSVPGTARFGDAVIAARTATAAGPPRPDRVAVRVEGPLVVRPPAAGDRVPLAGGGRRAVGRLLADAGVPARGRGWVPVVATPERPVWVAGHRAAHDLLADPGEPATELRLQAPRR